MDAATAFKLRDELQGTVAEHPDYPHDAGSEHASVPVFQGASVTDADSVTHQIGDLLKQRDDGLIVTADPGLIHALSQSPALVRVEAPEPANYDGVKVSDLLKLPQVAEIAKVTDPSKLRKPALVAAIVAVDELGGTVADLVPGDDSSDQPGDAVLAAIANADQGA